MNFLLSADENSSFDFNKIWNDIVTFFTTKYWNILWFLLVLVVGFLLVKIFAALFRKMLTKTKMEHIAQSFLVNIVKFLLYLIWILVLLSIVGVNITGVVTAISAAVLAIGMALQSNISNLANGIIIVSAHMINTGDFISVGDITGKVQTINFLFTTINTTDNKKVYLPNSTVVNSALVNYGSNGTRRVDFTFSVSYESDVDLVKKTIIEVMDSYNKVFTDPAPFCRLKNFGESSIDFFANCWCNSDDYWDVYYYIMENVFNEFKRNNIIIPYPQREVRLRTDTPIMGYNEEKKEREELPPPPPQKQKSFFAKKVKEIKDKLDD